MQPLLFETLEEESTKLLHLQSLPLDPLIGKLFAQLCPGTSEGPPLSELQTTRVLSQSPERCSAAVMFDTASSTALAMPL